MRSYEHESRRTADDNDIENRDIKQIIKKSLRTNHELRSWLGNQVAVQNQDMKLEDTMYGKKAFNETTGTFDRVQGQGDGEDRGDRSDTVTKIMPTPKPEDINAPINIDTVHGNVV